MPTFTADVSWSLAPDEDFRRGRYSRGYVVRFDGGAEVAGSASPHVVGRFADAAAVDPEEMLVASLSACHMLFFLHLAREAGFAVLAYRDAAEGVMTEIGPGRQAVTEVVLRPRIDWAGTPPDAAAIERLHHAAHDNCFIANSVKTRVSVAAPATANLADSRYRG